MDYNVLEEKKNAPMKRKELKVEVPHTRNATVSKANVQKAVAAKEKVPATHVHVDRVVTQRGTTKSIATVEVYEEPKSKDLSGSAQPAAEATSQETAPAEEKAE